MIRIEISGAGGGKTTGLVEKIYNRYNGIINYKKIFVITYTNYAVNQIINSYVKKYGVLPKNVKIMTVHKFCIQEIINPYYKYTFQKTPIENIVTFKYNHNRKYYEFSRLLDKSCIHTDNVFSMSKWILCGKSNFSKNQKEVCKNNFKYFISDVDSIFIDEYQDLDIDILTIILKIIDQNSINISIVGDPKQQIMGRDYSRWFILELEKRNIIPTYNSNCYRCGANLITLSNKLCLDTEQQITEKSNMILKYIFYDELESIVSDFQANKEDFLVYMKESNEKFTTNKESINDCNLNFEDVSSYDKKYINTRIQIIIKNNSYSQKEKIMKIKDLLSQFNIELSAILRMQLLDYLNNNISCNSNLYKIYSINKVKGLEADYCFYIIDNNFLKYLIDTPKRNMESNKIYVALTRAKKGLYLVIPREFKRLDELESLGFKYLI